jgi:hypothetical protein
MLLMGVMRAVVLVSAFVRARATCYVATPKGYACRTEAQVIETADECARANAELGNILGNADWSTGAPAEEVGDARYLPGGCLFMLESSMHSGRTVEPGLTFHTHQRGFANDVREDELEKLYSICQYTADTASDPAGHCPSHLCDPGGGNNIDIDITFTDPAEGLASTCAGQPA